MICHIAIIAIFSVSLYVYPIETLNQEKELQQLAQELKIALDAYLRSLTPEQRVAFERYVAEVESGKVQIRREDLFPVKTSGWRSWFSFGAWRDWWKSMRSR